MEMARHLPAGTLAEQLDETDTRLWRFIAHYVDEARRLEDYMGVEAIGIDETSRRGRNYITVVADLVEHDVINVTPGKDPATVERFSRDFPALPWWWSQQPRCASGWQRSRTSSP